MTMMKGSEFDIFLKKLLTGDGKCLHFLLLFLPIISHPSRLIWEGTSSKCVKLVRFSNFVHTFECIDFGFIHFKHVHSFWMYPQQSIKLWVLMCRWCLARGQSRSRWIRGIWKYQIQAKLYQGRFMVYPYHWIYFGSEHNLALDHKAIKSLTK